MSNFVNLRLILQDNRPDFRKFKEELSRDELKKGDLDLLLRKLVDCKVPDFQLFCDVLVKKGANVNFSDSKDNISNLMVACEKGTLQMVSSLLSYKEINVLHCDNRQLNACFYAIENRGREDSQNILRMLLQREPSLVNKVAGNETLLIKAIRKSKVEIIKMLLQFKADPNWQVPDTGNTALHDAVKLMKSKASQANKQIIRLLLVHGGDSLKKNKQQKTVYDYAQNAIEEYKKIEEKAKKVKVQVVLQLNTEQDFAEMFRRADCIFDKYQQVEEESEGLFLDEGQAYKQLNEQIYEWEEGCLKDYDQACEQVQNWMAKFGKIINPQGICAQITGSFATGLWIKHCSIDIFLFKKDFYDLPHDCLQKIQEQLKKAHICKSSTIIHHLKSGKMSMIKVEIESKYYQKSRLIYLTTMDRNSNNNNSLAISRFIIQQKKRYPILQPIFYVTKYLTYHYKLSLPKSGGLKTYALIIMLLSCIAKWSQTNPQKLLVDFLYYFGFYYEYQYEINPNPTNPSKLYRYEFNNDQDSDPYLMALHILDPINTSHNVGKQVRASELQKMFKTAYLCLHLNIRSGKRLSTMFDSHKIILS